MADLQKFSKQLVDVAERLADVADAARGQRSRRIGAMRWLLLPAAGAAAYAVAKRGSTVAARAKGGAREAKERPPEQPDLDLLTRLKDVAGVADDDQQEFRARAQEHASGQPDSEQLERNREERAKRRQRRRKSASA